MHEDDSIRNHEHTEPEIRRTKMHEYSAGQETRSLSKREWIGIPITYAGVVCLGAVCGVAFFRLVFFLWRIWCTTCFPAMAKFFGSLSLFGWALFGVVLMLVGMAISASCEK